LQSSSFKKMGPVLLNIVVGIGAFTTVVSLGLFAYLGTFTRYLADDYCDTVRVTSGPVLGAVLYRYLHTSDRYSNLLYSALIEFVLPRHIQVVPAVMILSWTLAFIWLVSEIKRLAGVRWSFLADVFLGSLLAFFPVLEAPNLFQTIYWRSGMATHFAPLVYLTAFSALLLHMVRHAGGQTPSAWLGVLCCIVAFFAGGFSEPPDAMLIVASLFALVAVWARVKGPRRAVALPLLAWTLAGGTLALLVMKFSPANSLRLQGPPLSLSTLTYRTLLYSIQFILDSFATLPLPIVVSTAIPLAFFYSLFAVAPAFSSRQRQALFVVAATTPLWMYILIASSFAPSVYGQSYPVERARFAGRLIMTSASMLEGACFGALLAQWKNARSPRVLVHLASVLLAISALYPLRGAARFLQANLADYRQWSLAWDSRQAQILAEKARGEQDIVVPPLPNPAGVKELNTHPEHYVNRCAAKFYGVHEIRALQHDP